MKTIQKHHNCPVSQCAVVEIWCYLHKRPVNDIVSSLMMSRWHSIICNDKQTTFCSPLSLSEKQTTIRVLSVGECDHDRLDTAVTSLFYYDPRNTDCSVGDVWEPFFYNRS